MSLTKKIKKVKTTVNSNKINNKSNTKTYKTIKGLNIYKITNIFNKKIDCWDCAYGFIILAKNELSARQIIYKEEAYGDEEYRWSGSKGKKNFWLNSEYSKCELIGKSCLKNEGIVLIDFQDG